MAGRLFWLASYPKSGNTWFRAFLANIVQSNTTPASINDLATDGMASTRFWLDDILGFDTADLYPAEAACLRPIAQDWLASDLLEDAYFKVHDALHQSDDGSWIISPKSTAGAVYLLRNPLDVAISYAHHNSSDIDTAIEYMNNPDHRLSADKQKRLNNQLEQRLLTWSRHVESWVDNQEIGTLVVRYEDMLHKPTETFTRAVRFLRIDATGDAIVDAITRSSFDELQQQEDEQTFRERPAKAARFFRKGVAGDWQAVLTSQQIDTILLHHGHVMQRFGYIDDAGNPKVC